MASSMEERALKKVYEAEMALRDAVIAIPEDHPMMGRIVGEYNRVTRLRKKLKEDVDAYPRTATQ